MPPIETLNYSHDANGNITVKEQSVAAAQETPFTAQYDGANRLTQITFHPGAANAATYDLTYDLTYDTAGYLAKGSAGSGLTRSRSAGSTEARGHRSAREARGQV